MIQKREPRRIYGFLRHGRLLCSPGGARSDLEAGLAADWRAPAARGMDHIGPCFDPTDRMGLGGDEHGTDGDEAGRRFFVDDGVTPAGTHVTGLPGPRQEPAAYQRQAPACWSAKREAADWSREHDAGLLAREERFAAERARLRLEVLFAANTHTIGN